MWVTAVEGMPFDCTCQVCPPSSLRTTPPAKVSGLRLRHIFGRGRSGVWLTAAQRRPRVVGSNSTQYVVLAQFPGTPLRVAEYQLAPPLSVANAPMSV